VLGSRPRQHASALGLANHARPKVHGLSDPRRMGMTNMSDLTNNKQRGQLCTLVVMREKRKKIQTINHWQQSNHYLFTRTTPCGRGHGCASNETADGQIWPLESVTHASLMARAPPIHYERKRKPKKCLVRRWEIESENIITIHNNRSLDL
jgi:hypothetical protein